MDEASRLVSELQRKLDELDHRVWQYRQDMASEFTKYADGLLHDVPKDVSDEVSKAVAESRKSSEVLNATPAHTAQSRATGGHFSPYQAALTTVITHETEKGDMDSQRSPHEREKEFQGLFTPSYLPLLDSTSRNERRSSGSSQTSVSGDIKANEKETEGLHVDGNKDAKSLAVSPEFPRPPTPKRRNTDEVSGSSDSSDSPVRRSALRRSSSSSKPQSPRRVRFQVEGEEVLPTTSPVTTESILSADGPESSLILGDDSDLEVGSIEVENVDDVEEPAPRRISSSQALRALSRGPLEDDGTMWTTVYAPPDGSPSVPVINGASQKSSIGDLDTTNPSSGLTTSDQSGAPLDLASADLAAAQRTSTEFPSNEPGSNTSKDDTEIKSDDDMLDMPRLKPMRSHKPSTATILSPIDPIGTNDSKMLGPTKRPAGRSWFSLESTGPAQEGGNDEDLKFLEEDVLFQFDESSEHRLPPEEEQVDSDLDSPTSPITEKEPLVLSKYSSSPAPSIPKRNVEKASNPSSKGIVGSYKGHPFSLPIVSDEIHAHAASLGDLNSFVGSVNGRSGLDESDVQSFRASGGVGSFSGTPRSLSERMMMEDLLEAEKLKFT